jgi:hypothetical protein
MYINVIKAKCIGSISRIVQNSIGTVFCINDSVEYKALGMLECNGAEISRSDYPELFGAIGSSYGDGDGVTTFNLPKIKAHDARQDPYNNWEDPYAIQQPPIISKTKQEIIEIYKNILEKN